MADYLGSENICSSREVVVAITIGRTQNCFCEFQGPSCDFPLLIASGCQIFEMNALVSHDLNLISARTINSPGVEQKRH